MSVEVFSKSGARVENRSSFEVVVEFSRAVRGFDANDMNVVNGDVTRFSGSGSEYEATVTAAAPGTVVVLIPKAAALDQNGHSNETSQPFTRTARTPEIPEITATAIAAGAYHSCAIRTDGTIACWGGNYSGQTDAPAGQHTAIAAGAYHSCAIRTNGTIACWGDNDFGQTDAPAGQYTAIAAGASPSCAIRTNGTIACWGDNYSGQTDAPAGQHTAIAAGAYHSCAIRTNGTIACWGDNLHGQTDVPAGQLSANISSDYIVAESPDNEYFDTWDRDAVLALFAEEFHRQEPDDGWTGDVESCVAGTTSQQYRDSVFQRINWFRQMAGVDSVVENPEFSYFAQQAALIMAANGALSHYPLADWTCYTSDGLKGASNSNLTVGSGVASIDNYIQDFGSNNIAVGHRRWILNPFAVEFGTGDIPNSSNALYVIPSSNQGSHETREERGFVAWPPPGYVPASVSWPRWSFDLSDPLLLADFSSASVEVFDDLGPVEVEIIYRHPLGVVWAMDGAAYSNLLAQSNSCYTVTIGDVKISGSVQTPYEYAVCIVT